MRLMQSSPIKYKLMLIIMSTVVVSLLLVGSAVIISERYVAKKSMTGQLMTVSRIIADRSTAALSFDDQKAAAEMLSALSHESTIVLACIYDRSQSLFATYAETASLKCPVKAQGEGHRFFGENFELYQSIVLEGEPIGTVYLRASLRELDEHLLHFILLVASIISLASIVAYFLANKQQAVISKPILDLADAAKQISIQADYSVRLPQGAADEIGTLNRAFNTMLEQIRKREAALVQSKAEFEAMFNAIPDAVIFVDPERRIVLINPAVHEIFGYSDEELIGRTTEMLYADPQDFLDQGKQRFHTGSVTAKGVYEASYRRKDGSIFWGETLGTQAKDANGNPIGFIGMLRDITERQQTEEALHRSQKMEAIGQLSGGIAHDFNNQLGVIIGYLDFLEKHTASDEKSNRWVTIAIRATQRCMDLTRQLLAFSRRQAKKKSVVALNDKVREMETMIARSITPEVEVQYFLADDLWLTEIDPGEFQDAILNLVINARDAMPGGGKLLIETGNKHLDADYAALDPGVEVGDYVQLMISDTGAGMDRETLEHVFEPFFTTKPEGKGTGLGMAMVYGFVKRYGGNIKMYSEVDVGTSIRLYLPRSGAAETTTVADDSNGFTLPTGSESILIVDDEVDLLQLADQYLSSLGYRTQLAGNAAQALEILAGNKKFDLLFSDVVMPGGMNGYELAQLATNKNPGLKVLLTSGFIAKTNADNGLARFSAHLLNKPYRKGDLAQRIRLVLDEVTADANH